MPEKKDDEDEQSAKTPGWMQKCSETVLVGRVMFQESRL